MKTQTTNIRRLCAKLGFTLAVIFFTPCLMAQTPELVSDAAAYPTDLTKFNGKVFFSARAQDGKSWLWSTDGTSTVIRGTGTVLNTHPGSQPRGLTVFNNQLFLSSVIKEGADWNRELFVYVGITDKLKLIKNIQSGGSSDPFGFTEYTGNLYFTATGSTHGKAMWISDGSNSGTKLFKDIDPNIGYGGPNGYFEYDGKLLFEGSDNTHGVELWVTNGTSTGTKMIKEIYPGTVNGVSNSGYTIFKNKVYFVGVDPTYGKEPYVTDGTESGTHMLKNIKPNRGDSHSKGFTEYNGKLYFKADEGTNGEELWITDGTEMGTGLFKDIVPGQDGSYPSLFTEYNGKLYFRAYKDSKNGLWVTDGTNNGTVMVKSLPGYFEDMFTYDDRLYLVAQDGYNGFQLWASDGTSSGTEVVVPAIAPNNDPLIYSSHIVVDGTLYYTADYDGNGEKLWKLTTNNLSVEDNTKNKFVAYPNPVRNILRLETAADNIQKIELLSVTGQLLKSWKGKSEINISQFATGSYFVRIITDDDRSEVKQILKN